jgi:uncharacterized protein (DUF1501 family)
MNLNRNSRREFLHKLCCLAASGGAAALIPQLRMMGTALANSSKSLSGYKALVCVNLSGGNDAWNMLVPFDTTRFGVYTTSRSGLYDPTTNPGGLGLPFPTGAQVASQKIIDGNDSDPSTNEYFLHPNLTEMVSLYNQAKSPLSLAVNVGTLIEPITMTQYNASSANSPPQLFSHADQTSQWQQAYASSVATTGWGGLCAENLQGQGANNTTSPQLPLAISIDGANRFEVGASSVPYQISSGGLVNLSGMCNPTPCSGHSNTSYRDGALTSLLGDTYENDFASQYGQVFQLGRELNNLLGTLLTDATLNTTFPTGNSLAAQLEMVAKMIKVSIAQNFATRQIYYVQLGGFDLHSGMMSGAGDHASLLTLLSKALNAFWDSMGAGDVNAADDVTVFTSSEFARTLQSNGSGSDHGWGSVHMALGGAVNGGKLYTNGGGLISGFPNESLKAPNNFSRGQMIPGIGVEQYAATLAQWMGITSTTDLEAIFPNLINFGTSNFNLGFV